MPRDIRLVLDGSPKVGLTDIARDEAPAVWDADGIRISFFLSDLADREDEFDLSTISALTLEFREDETESDLLIAAVSPEAALSACTYADFLAGTDKHGSFLLTGTQMNFADGVGRFWASIRATLTSGGPITFGAGYITVRQTLHGTSGDPPSGALGTYQLAGLITVKHTTGAADDVFSPASDSDTARGAALIAAFAAHAAGDDIDIGPGTFYIGTTQLVCLAGVSIRGRGWSTIIKADKLTNNIHLVSNVTVENLKIICTTPSSSGGHSLLGNASAGFTGVRVINCWIVGEQDVFNGWGVHGTQSMLLRDCRIETQFDWLNATAGTGTIDLENTRIYADASTNVDPDAGLDGINLSTGLTVNARGCYWNVTHPPSGGHSPGIVINGGTGTFRDCQIVTETGGYDIQGIGTGTCLISGGMGSGVNGAYKTTGTAPSFTVAY